MLYAEWSTLCTHYDGMKLMLEALGFERVDLNSAFWEKDNSFARLILSANDGVVFSVDGKEKFRIKRHPCEVKEF